MAMSAIANQGKLMRPMLVKRLEEPAGAVVVSADPGPPRQVIGTVAARDMVEALKTVVTKNGTGSKAHLENYTVAGKTGTAQKVEHGTYSTTKFFASFIGFFPPMNLRFALESFWMSPKAGLITAAMSRPRPFRPSQTRWPVISTSGRTFSRKSLEPER